jgi:hypothetical protein
MKHRTILKGASTYQHNGESKNPWSFYRPSWWLANKRLLPTNSSGPFRTSAGYRAAIFSALARLRHADRTALCLSSDVTRKTYARTEFLVINGDFRFAAWS